MENNMSKIKNEGNYRGHILSSGVGLTKNEYPQLIMEVQAEEVHEQNETGGEWVPCEEPFETIVAYLVLVDSTGAITKNAEQIQASLGWSGKSFSELNDTDYSDTTVQFRVEKNEYPPGTFKMQVSWLNPYDADPTRSITKLDKTALKNLNSKYGAALRAFGKKTSTKAAAKPASTPKKSSGPPKKTKVEYTANAVYDRLQKANPDLSEDVLCEVWENLDDIFTVETDDRTAKDWKLFEETLTKTITE